MLYRLYARKVEGHGRYDVKRLIQPGDNYHPFFALGLPSVSVDVKQLRSFGLIAVTRP